MDRIIELVSKYSGTPPAEINANTNLLHDLRMESMGFIDMVCEFEDTFGFKIPERDFRKFITVKKIAAYVEEKAEQELRCGGLCPTAGSLTTAEQELRCGGQALPTDSDSSELPLTKSRCIVSPMTRKLTEKVPDLVRAIYGDGYAAQYLYSPAQFWEKVENGDVYPYIAVNGEGKAHGMISLIKLSPNPNAFELGQLMVTPEYRGTDVAKLLISCISNQELKVGVIYSESVTSHKYSQRSCIAGGFTDTALKLNIANSHGAGHGESTRSYDERISCVCSCIERGQAVLWNYLPSRYSEQVKFALGELPELSTRLYRKSSDTAPDNPTVYVLNDSEHGTSQYVVATFTEIGRDVTDVAAKLDEYAIAVGVKSLAVKLPLNCPHNGAAVDALNACGFFYGGVMPRWYPDSDGLLMQKLYGNVADWDKTKLFSAKIQTIAESIKNDVC